jgi:hypothetical protein
MLNLKSNFLVSFILQYYVQHEVRGCDAEAPLGTNAQLALPEFIIRSGGYLHWQLKYLVNSDLQ